MKKVSNSCLAAALLSNLFMVHLQKGSIDCISFTEVSLVILTVVICRFFINLCPWGVVRVYVHPRWWLFFGSLNGWCLSHFVSSGDGYDHIYQHGFVPFGFFWCFSGSPTNCDRQSAALFFAPEIHSNFML